MQEVSTTELKEKVARNFGDKAKAYNMYAHVQRQAAQRFIDLSGEYIKDLDSPYLEIGCGTGFITQPIVKLIGGGTYIAADLSVEMLEACRMNVPDKAGLNILFEERDGESDLTDSRYGLIVTALTAQWFNNTEYTLKQYLEALKPGGMLIYSYLDERCFPEWKALCAETGVPFTGNILPACKPIAIDAQRFEWAFFSMELFTEIFDTPASFFRNLKRIGAGTRQNGRPNNPGAIVQLDEHWKHKTTRKFQVTYGITFGGIRRKFDSE
ncbi:MAG: methyltransferase domain-containing protein [Bacteroidetes bacterium]|nr:methyltransferase domain-containing protein [Bacteroidota bacterium]MCH8524136.1 methyltransferase domain-containing protein [Balneolales bacterium]